MDNGRSSKTSLKSTSRLQRNRSRSRLGGVCAGLADYIGIDITIIRFIFLFFGFFGGMGFWLYLILWAVLPLTEDTPIPKVTSHSLKRTLRKIESMVRTLHKKHDPVLADAAQRAFDVIKVLAPYFDTGKDTQKGALVDADLMTAALHDFPNTLEQWLTLSSTTSLPKSVFLEKLKDFHLYFEETARECMEHVFRTPLHSSVTMNPELAAWHEQLEPLKNRLRERIGDSGADTLRSIEEKLAFLLARMDDHQEILDLRPFEVRKIAFEYLPDTLNQYLALPSGMAKTEPLSSGKTAEETLHDQLVLLDRTLHHLAKSFFENDAKGLLIHGRFLKEKFSEHLFQ